MSVGDQLVFEGMLLVTVLIMIAPLLISDWRKRRAGSAFPSQMTPKHARQGDGFGGGHGGQGRTAIIHGPV